MNMRLIRDAKPDDIIFNHFVNHVPYPVVPGSEFCLRTPAMVVMPFDPATKKLPKGALTVVGSLDLMVTELEYELAPSFKQLSGGRDVASFKVAGVMAGGVFKPGAVSGVRAPEGRLQVTTLGGGKKVVVLKDLKGNWLIPSSVACCGQIVLVAEEKTAAHLDAWEHAVAASKKGWEATSDASKKGWGKAEPALKRGWEKTAETTKKGWEKTAEATAKGAEATAKKWGEFSEQAGPALKDGSTKATAAVSGCVERSKANVDRITHKKG